MIRREVWLLPQPVRTAPTAMTGFELFSIVSLRAEEHEVRARRLHDRGNGHHVLVGDVAVGEHAVVDLQVGG